MGSGRNTTSSIYNRNFVTTITSSSHIESHPNMARRSIVCARRSKYARDDQKRDNDLKKDIHNGCSSSYKNADICSFNVFKNICQVLCHRTHWLSLVTVRVMVVTKFRLHTMVNDIEDLF